MPRGGKRPGAGRPVGATTQKTRAIADQAAAEGLTPLDVMLRAMREHATAERWDEAAKVAAMAAPFIHPRLAAVAMAHDVSDPLADLLRHMEGRCRGIPGGAAF